MMCEMIKRKDLLRLSETVIKPFYHYPFLSQGWGKKQLAQVFGKDPDRFVIGLFPLPVWRL